MIRKFLLRLRSQFTLEKELRWGEIVLAEMQAHLAGGAMYSAFLRQDASTGGAKLAELTEARAKYERLLRAYEDDFVL